ncbi:hypothetical protein BGZ76_000860 [Entomortierella beljakovae]|nr:hypothetical protein BGZ76_000860 [Entomortierella beljakovae]
MTNGNFPNLRHLKFCRIHLDDEQIALAFDTIALVKTFCVGTNQFSHNSFRSLMTKHANTISTLKLGRSSKIEGHMVQDILSGCPSLLHFSANSIKGSDIARYGWVTNRYSFHFACHTDNDNCTNPDEIILEKDWVCLGLISLDMSFDMGYNVLTDIHRHTHECQEKYKRQQKLEQYHAFRQLSRLQQLESLEIQRKTYNDSSYSLDLRFKAEGGELEQLLPLQKLKHFDFGRIDQKHYLKLFQLFHTFTFAVKVFPSTKIIMDLIGGDHNAYEDEATRA